MLASGPECPGSKARLWNEVQLGGNEAEAGPRLHLRLANFSELCFSPHQVLNPYLQGTVVRN